jgi:hypothetical protein
MTSEQCVWIWLSGSYEPVALPSRLHSSQLSSMGQALVAHDPKWLSSTIRAEGGSPNVVHQATVVPQRLSTKSWHCIERASVE